MMKVRLIDPSCPSKECAVQVHLFALNEQDFPSLARRGDILRLHRAKVSAVPIPRSTKRTFTGPIILWKTAGRCLAENRSFVPSC